jgi:hypothetical protein
LSARRGTQSAQPVEEQPLVGAAEALPVPGLFLRLYDVAGGHPTILVDS